MSNLQKENDELRDSLERLRVKIADMAVCQNLYTSNSTPVSKFQISVASVIEEGKSIQIRY